MKVRRKKAKARPPQPDATERLVGAFHEAAHAFEAHSLGLDVDRVTLDEDEAREANPTFIGFTSRECGTAEENARVALAGRVADAIMEDRLGLRLEFPEVEQHHDELSAQQWAMHAAQKDLAKARVLHSTWVAQAFERTDFFGDPRYRALAKALFEAGALDRERILEILGPLPAVAPEVEAQRRAVHESITS